MQWTGRTESIEFEKQPTAVQDFRTKNHPFFFKIFLKKNTFEIYLKLVHYSDRGDFWAS